MHQLVAAAQLMARERSVERVVLGALSANPACSLEGIVPGIDGTHAGMLLKEERQIQERGKQEPNRGN
jgi:hypothetical protein